MVVKGHRQVIKSYLSLLGGASPSEFSYLFVALMAIIFISGLFYFERVERMMADIV